MPPPTERSSVTSLYVSGRNTVVYSFPSRDCLSEWERQLRTIKHHMIDLNTAAARDDWDDERVASSISEWFGLVGVFQETFGQDVVPPDVVRAARNNNLFLESVNVPPVPFPKEGLPPPTHSNCRVVKTFSSELE